MAKYTFVVDYKDGTYISQIQASDEVDALERWCEFFPTEKIKGVKTAKVAAAVREWIAIDKPVALDGLTGAWCTGAPVGRRSSVMINIILSAD